MKRWLMAITIAGVLGAGTAQAGGLYEATGELLDQRWVGQVGGAYGGYMLGKQIGEGKANTVAKVVGAIIGYQAGPAIVNGVLHGGSKPVATQGGVTVQYHSSGSHHSGHHYSPKPQPCPQPVVVHRPNRPHTVVVEQHVYHHSGHHKPHGGRW